MIYAVISLLSNTAPTVIGAQPERPTAKTAGQQSQTIIHNDVQVFLKDTKSDVAGNTWRHKLFSASGLLTFPVLASYII